MLATWRPREGAFERRLGVFGEATAAAELSEGSFDHPARRPRNHPDAVQLFGGAGQAMKRAVADVGVQSLLPGDWRQPFIDGRTKQEHSLDRLLGPWHSVTQWRWCRRRTGRFRALPFRTSFPCARADRALTPALLTRSRDDVFRRRLCEESAAVQKRLNIEVYDRAKRRKTRKTPICIKIFQTVRKLGYIKRCPFSRPNSRRSSKKSRKFALRTAVREACPVDLGCFQVGSYGRCNGR